MGRYNFRPRKVVSYAPYPRSVFGNSSIGRSLQSGMEARFNNARRRSGTPTSRQGPSRSSGGGIISQYNQNALKYRRKGMPKYKKKRWSRFKKKTLSVVYGATKKQVIYHKDGIDIAAPVDGVAHNQFSLYTSFETGAGDLNDISRCLQVLRQSAIQTQWQVQDVMFKSARMDITIQSPVTFNSVANQAMYIDIYWYRAMKNSDNDASVLMDRGFQQLAAGGQNEPTVIGVPMTTAAYGSTPFSSRPFCQNCKIYKVTKHLLPVGQTLEFTIKDKKDRIYRNAIADSAYLNQVMLRNWTQGILVIVYGVPGAALGAAGQYALPGGVYVRREVTYKCHYIDAGTTERIVDYT